MMGPSARTIGEYLRRTRAYSWRFFILVAMVWIATVLLMGSGIPLMQRLRPGIGGVAVLSAVMFLIVWLVIRSRLRCPRCGADFRQERFAKLGRWSFDTRGTGELWDACPRCGVSFNDPLR
jgi:hypothetical protein